MRAISVRTSFYGCPESILALGFSAESVVNVTVNKEYPVWAVSRWRGILFFQVINDFQIPDWLPSWLFELTDRSIPNGWLCSFFNDDIEMILGPCFLAESQDAYQAMVELTPESVEAFWHNVKKSKSQLY